jgi:hypothetical protein
MEDECMDSLDNFRERFEALEQQTAQLMQHTRTLERRLRWWRGIACGVVLLSLLSLGLPSGKAEGPQPGGMAERMATLEKKLTAMTFDDAANEVVITGANLRIVNGLGTTNTTNGLGNLIVGYNEERGDGTDNRTGSHNVVVGREHNFSSFGGLVVGVHNEISGEFASVSGGAGNTASGGASSVSGGNSNTSSGGDSSVSGGSINTASGPRAVWVGGGIGNTASGESASVCAGNSNTATGFSSSVCGGNANTASGVASSVSGGTFNTASGESASVSGGESNTASGLRSSVSGGRNRSAPAPFNWAAGALFSDM